MITFDLILSIFASILAIVGFGLGLYNKRELSRLKININSNTLALQNEINNLKIEHNEVGKFSVFSSCGIS